MTDQEKLFYRNLYKLISDEANNSILVKYAEMQYNKNLAELRSRTDLYGIARANGNMDAWQAIINLKEHLIKIVREI